jgi:hypothetical protein
VTTPVAVTNGVATFSVPAASAAWIQAAPVATSIGVPYDGLCADGTATPSLQQSTCSSTSQGQDFVFVPTPNGFFNIVAQNSNLCLDWVNTNAAIVQNACSTTSTQQWTIQQNPNSTYEIVSNGGAYCLSAAPGTTLGTSNCNGNPNETFSLSNPPITPLQTATSVIDVPYDTMCVDLNGGEMVAGQYIRQHWCNGTINQSWLFSSTTDGYYTISSSHSQLCIDGATANSPVNQNPCSAGPSQKWKLILNSDGSYSFAGDGSQMCLGIPGTSTVVDTQLTPYTCDGGPDQKFKLPTPPPII